MLFFTNITESIVADFTDNYKKFSKIFDNRRLPLTFCIKNSIIFLYRIGQLRVMHRKGLT